MLYIYIYIYIKTLRNIYTYNRFILPWGARKRPSGAQGCAQSTYVLHIYIYIYIYTCVCMYRCMYMYIYIYIYV